MKKQTSKVKTTRKPKKEKANAGSTERDCQAVGQHRDSGAEAEGSDQAVGGTKGDELGVSTDISGAALAQPPLRMPAGAVDPTPIPVAQSHLGGLAARLRQSTVVQPLTSDVTPTEEQQAILNAVVSQHPVLVVEAGAGAGKTLTLKMIGRTLPGRGQYTAFNASLVAESKSKFAGLPVACNTTHSLAFRAEGTRFEHRLGGNRVRGEDVAKMLGIESINVPYGDGDAFKRLAPGFLASQVLGAIKRFCQSADPEVTGSHFKYIDGIDLPVDGSRTYANNEKVRDYLLPFAQIAWTDICDVEGHLPFAHDHYVKIWQLNKPVISADYILLDECLPGWTPVMMDNGSSKMIKDIQVGERVRSYNTKTGRAMNCSVTATQKIPNKKPLLKIKVKHNHKTEGKQRWNFVVCTVDHKVWTVNRGWVEAQEIQLGDSVIIETAAATTQKGKISQSGRDNLSRIHLGNKKGGGTASRTQTKEQFNSIKGGNGRGLTTPQQLLLDALGEGWEPEYIVATKLRHEGYPSAYKIDLAHKGMMVAIELDGASHAGANEVDNKKDVFLRNNGWTVFRIKNREVARNLPEVLQRVCIDGQSCPMVATVQEVDKTYITEHFVYDISVDICHAFYANGILVHNCQDTAEVMLDILKQQTCPVILVGDSAQQIYEWRGAVNAMSEFPDAPTYTLSQSFRFGSAIAEVANAILAELSVPAKLRLRGFDKVQSRVTEVKEPVAVLCRTNAVAVATLLSTIADGKTGFLIGGGADTIAFVRGARDLMQGQATGHPDLACFSSWSDVQEYVKQDEGDDLKLMVKIIDEFGADTLLTSLSTMPTEESLADRVISTAHKSKGREWKSVKLASDFPTKSKSSDADIKLLYVAATRAQELLDVSECPFFTGTDSLDIRSIRDRFNSISQTVPSIVPPTPIQPPAPTTFTWSSQDGKWLVKGPSGQVGSSVPVVRKDGSVQTKRLISVFREFSNTSLYTV